MGVFLGLCTGPLPIAGVQAAAPGTKAEAAVENSQPVHTVSGILSMLDVSTGKAMLKTDLNKPIFFKVGRPDLFARLSIGDRITVQLDGEGRAVKVIEELPEEMPALPPPAK